MPKYNKKTRKNYRKKGGFCLTKKCKQKKREKEEKKNKEATEDLLYSLAYDSCPLTTKEEFDQCVEDIVHKNNDNDNDIIGVRNMLLRSKSAPTQNISPPPPPALANNIKRSKSMGHPITPPGLTKKNINPIIKQKAGKKLRKRKKRTRRRKKKRKSRRYRRSR